ncbi:MAG: hypothetical protein Q9216_005221 [Gyalolechia sp. 2 TL-2023]
MAASLRTSSVFPSTKYTDSCWDVVSIDKLGRIGQNDYMIEPPHLTVGHRRGRTEGLTRRSLFSMRSRSHTMSNTSIRHATSPSTSVESQEIHRHDMETSRPQSSWSDSDQSDDETKSWMVKGSKILKKQNGKFNLSSSRRGSWLDESDKIGGQSSKTHHRGNKQDDRTWPAHKGDSTRPMISTPFNFRHLTHTQAHQFANLHNASQERLVTEFSAIKASQVPQQELQGIRTEDLRSPTSGSSSPRYQIPVTPPALSPTKPSTPRSKNGLSINAPGRLSHSRSIDNFSQPSPKLYRTPRSPATPPASAPLYRTTSAVPDFFSDIHHATAGEREMLSQYRASAELSGSVQSLPDSEEQMFYDENLPHAITTSEDIALTLKPSLTRRSALALADVPEEDEFHPIRRVSDQGLRPVTADPALRHATTFPSNNCSPRRKRASSSHGSFTVSSTIPAPTLNPGSPDARPEEADDVDACPQRDASPHMSTDVAGIDACWEDDIDYCYQLKAEADCDFDWDRLSMDRTLTMDKPHSPQAPIGACQDVSEPLSTSRACEKLDTPNSDLCQTDAKPVRHSDDHHLPRLQTSLPDLDFSAASSAKSSMASLRGPVTPLQQLPSPRKIKPTLQVSKSTDTLNIESSYLASAECGMPWSQEDSFHKVPSWDHASQFNYPFNNLSLSGSSKATSRRSSRPALSTHQSSDSLMLSNSASAVQTRRNTSSSTGFPELVCSKNYRQQTNMVAEQIADRIATLAVADRAANTGGDAGLAKVDPCMSEDAGRAFVPRNHRKTPSNHSLCNQEDDGVLVKLPSSKASDPSMSVASFAGRLRSNSVTSSASGSSSMRTSRNDLLCLRWPLPPQNILLVQKRNAPAATEALKEFAQHIYETYPSINVLLESDTASQLHQSFTFPIYSLPAVRDAITDPAALTSTANKVDLTATFGGDGTILRASSIFSSALSVPPILSFSMGTLGFLGEWKFSEFKRAFREVYMSGAGAGDRTRILEPISEQTIQPENAQCDTSAASHGPAGWSSIRGKSLGRTRGARVLLRHRLKVAVKSTNQLPITDADPATTHAMNEIIIHRGATPHLAHIAIYIGGRFLTEAVADGMIISTPTGSTAYSLSSGGSIIHPLVDSLCLTPICPRSLSFRPLVLPASTPVTLRLSEENNRGREVEVSIDGVRQVDGLRVGGEIRVVGEEIQRGKDGWRGGVPCIMRGGGEKGDDDGWVGGLNGLLKFNYPFGEEG